MSDWTVISDGRIDEGSPVDENLTTDIRENIEYNHERAIRAGTHATGQRLAITRGRKSFTLSTDGSGNGSVSVSITFATDSNDGDPNFDSSPTPIFVYSLEESPSSSVDWADATYGIAGPTVDAFNHWIEESTLDYQGATITIQGDGLKASDDYSGFVHYVAFSKVTSGE